MRSVLLVAAAALLAACGPSAPPKAAARQAPPPAASAAPAPAPTGPSVRFVLVQPAVVQAHVKPDRAAAVTWAKEPANAKTIQPTFRHILVKVTAGDAASEAAGKKKIDQLLAKLKKGEPMAKLAADSDDPGSAKTGGAYSGTFVAQFVPEVRAAFEALKPGAYTPAPVRSSFGLHVIAKDKPDDDDAFEAYGMWLLRDTADRIGHELTKGLAHVPAGTTAQAVAVKAFTDVLGVPASALGDELPEVTRFPASTPASELLPECQEIAESARQGAILAKGDVLAAGVITSDPADLTETVGGVCMLGKAGGRVEAAGPPPDPSSWVATPAPKPRVFEVFREDETDAIAATASAGAPKGAELKLEAAPAGAPGKKVARALVLVPRAPKEPEAAALARAKAAIASLRHPKGSFFVLEASETEDGSVDGYRSFLVKEPAILDDRDVASAHVEDAPPGPLVSVDLTPAAAKRFEEATSGALHRRLLVMIDGMVTSAPVVMAPIKAGRIAIAPPGATDAARKANAERIAKALAAPKR